MWFNIYTSNFFTALNDGAVSAAISFMRSLVLPTVCIIVMPMIWKLDGVWYSLAASEVLAFFVSFGFMLGKRRKYHYNVSFVGFLIISDVSSYYLSKFWRTTMQKKANGQTPAENPLSLLQGPLIVPIVYGWSGP